MKFKAQVIVKLKDNVKDAKGAAVNAVLKRIEFEENANVRIGKFFELNVNADSEEDAKEKLLNIIKEVFANPVVETYEVIDFRRVDIL